VRVFQATEWRIHLLTQALGEELGRRLPNSVSQRKSASLAHFRCVVAHEVRLLAASPEDCYQALAEGVGRYLGTTRMVCVRG
jgi:hypothetical protein